MAQLILRRREEATVEVVSELGETVRGAGGFGSSGSRSCVAQRVGVPKTLKMLAQLQNLLILQEFPIPF